MKSITRRAALLLTFAALFCLTGCGKSGPTRYDISGTVTFDGKPVPEGNISFEPTEGDVGGGYAFIRDGKFDTTVDGRGHMGGTHRIQITGFTGVTSPDNPDAGSPPLFEPYETSADLPNESGTMDFEVPSKK